MLHLFKLETVVVGLFSISLLLVAAYELCPKVVTVDGVGDEWFTGVEVDSSIGGNSFGDDQSNESELRYIYQLGNAEIYPYSVLLLSPQREYKMEKLAEFEKQAKSDDEIDWRNVFIEEQKLFSLDWMERIKIVGRVEGKKKETFRIHFRSRIDTLYDPSDPIPRIFTGGVFNLTDENKEVTLRREQFHVPSWWLEQFEVDLDKHNRPTFDAVEWIEFLPGSQSSGDKATLVIDSIRFEGHHFSRTAFYGFILGLWMTMAVGVIVKRTLVMAREVRSLEAKAEKANIDFLTGLLNRHAVKDSIASLQTFQNDPEKSLALVMFDIDHFKLLNDTYGHNYGDGVLKDLARVILRMTKDKPLTAFRWGGEEFLIICEGTDEQSGAQFADELRQQIETSVCVTCSFGVYELSRGEPFIEAIGKADKALYASKWRGRNCITCFSDFPEQLNQDNAEACQDPRRSTVEKRQGNVAGLVAAGENIRTGKQASILNVKF